jgi:hypothetical protein
MQARDWRCSPLRAPTELLRRLPRTFITYGASEQLHDQQAAMRARLEEAGVPLEAFVGEAMPHAFPMFAPLAFWNTITARRAAAKVAAARAAAAAMVCSSVPPHEPPLPPPAPPPPPPSVEALERIESYVASVHFDFFDGAVRDAPCERGHV